jgi:hypothetical protein
MIMTVDDWSVGMCPCGKVQFASERDVREFLRQKNWSIRGLNLYQHDGYWHFGHHNKLRKRRARDRRPGRVKK